MRFLGHFRRLGHHAPMFDDISAPGYNSQMVASSISKTELPVTDVLD